MLKAMHSTQKMVNKRISKAHSRMWRLMNTNAVIIMEQMMRHFELYEARLVIGEKRIQRLRQPLEGKEIIYYEAIALLALDFSI